MLCLILIVGGVLIMMGQHDRSEALFYYFRLEDQVPENHLLRLIDKHISFDFVRAQLKDSYSENGRPSIDPELLLRILLNHTVRQYVQELEQQTRWKNRARARSDVDQGPRFHLRHQGRHASSPGVLRQLSGRQRQLRDCEGEGDTGVAAQGMLTRFAQWQGRKPESVAAETTYGNGEFLQWLADRNISVYANPRQHPQKE